MKVGWFLKTVSFVLLAWVAALGVLHAQPTRGPGARGAQMGARGAGMLGGEMEIRRELFPPELVMRHQSEIRLTDDQRKSLVREMQALQSDLVPLQFDLSEASVKLRDALAGPRIDEGKAAALADALMTLETRIKRRHLGLMIRVKNILTPEQQSELRQLREDARDERRENFRRRRGARPGGEGFEPGPPEDAGDEPDDVPR